LHGGYWKFERLRTARSQAVADFWVPGVTVAVVVSVGGDAGSAGARAPVRRRVRRLRAATHVQGFDIGSSGRRLDN